MYITESTKQKVYASKKVSVETMQLKGYELIQELFVDSSGFGADDEPALTQNRFMNELSRIIAENNGRVYATITNAGQFQVYVGLFKKTGISKSKKIANNTYLIKYDQYRRAIRLHDTDILKYHNGCITLDNGGWDTRTTRTRMNQYLPDGVYVFRKRGETYLHDGRNNIDLPYVNQMVISGELSI